MSDAYKTFREVLEFPCRMEFKVIITALNPQTIEEVKACLRTIEPQGLLEITKPPRASRNGSYLSYSIPVKVSSEAHLERIYKEVAGLDGVLHVL